MGKRCKLVQTDVQPADGMATKLVHVCEHVSTQMCACLFVLHGKVLVCVHLCVRLCTCASVHE